MPHEIEIIIPAHNEEQRIAWMLEQCLAFFPAEILFTVVINGANDGTEAVVKRFTSQHPNVRYINIPAAIGKGGAVIYGFNHSQAEFVKEGFKMALILLKIRFFSF